MFKYIDTFEVHDPNILSDHCLITFSFSFEHDSIGEATQHTCNYEQAPGRFRWTNDFKTDFLNSLGDMESNEHLNRLNTCIPSCTESNELDQCLSDLSSVIERAASPIFKWLSSTKNEARPSVSNNNIPENPWFDEQCAEKKH